MPWSHGTGLPGSAFQRIPPADAVLCPQAGELWREKGDAARPETEMGMLIQDCRGESV
jgi:hypothetical protein